MHPGELGQRVAEQHREHAREADHRNRDQQVDPEEPPELGGVIHAVPGVTGMAVVGGVTGMAVVGGVGVMAAVLVMVRRMNGVLAVAEGHVVLRVWLGHTVILLGACAPREVPGRGEPDTLRGYSNVAGSTAGRGVAPPLPAADPRATRSDS